LLLFYLQNLDRTNVIASMFWSFFMLLVGQHTSKSFSIQCKQNKKITADWRTRPWAPVSGRFTFVGGVSKRKLPRKLFICALRVLIFQNGSVDCFDQAIIVSYDQLPLVGYLL